MHCIIQIHEAVVVQLHAFLTLVLDGTVWSALHLLHTLSSRKEPQYPLDRRLGGPRASLDVMVKKTSCSAKKLRYHKWPALKNEVEVVMMYFNPFQL
jgi:hypothetical protein